jgi:DNA-binding transcriptional LysR family regulator
MSNVLLQQLLTFTRVVEEGSFTRAADLLSLSQPAVTRQVAALEHELSVPLIQRRGKTFHLTPAGEIVFNYAREIAGLVERCREEVSSLSHPERGQVSVACVTTVGLVTLPGLIFDYRNLYPDVHIRVWSGRTRGVLDRMLDGSADLGLTSSPIMHPRLVSLPLFDDPIIPVAAPSLASRLPDPMPLEILSGQDLILYQAPSLFRTLVDGALEQAGVYARVAMEFDSHEAVRTAVSLGYGIALVPQEAVTDDLAHGRLVHVRVEGLGPITRTTSLVLRRRDPGRLPAVVNFVRLIVDRYRAGVAPDGTTTDAGTRRNGAKRGPEATAPAAAHARPRVPVANATQRQRREA